MSRDDLLRVQGVAAGVCGAAIVTGRWLLAGGMFATFVALIAVDLVRAGRWGRPE